MPATTRPVAGSRRRATRLATRLGSVTVLTILVAGIPYGLVRDLGAPVPNDGTWLPVDGQTRASVFALTLWACWLAFTASVVAELRGHWRRVPPRRLPLLRPVQQVAYRLVSGALATRTVAARTTARRPATTPPVILLDTSESSVEAGDPAPIADMPTAGLFATLTTHRAPAPATRRPATPLSPEPPLELAGNAARVDHALRTLTQALRTHPHLEPPDVVALWCDDTTTHLLLAAPRHDAPPPWHPTPHGTAWLLTPDAPLPEPDDLAPLPPALPCQATLAHRPGGQLAVDLERTGLLTITGDPQRRYDLLRALATEAATSPWTAGADIAISGFTTHDTHHLTTLDPGRVHAHRSPTEALAHTAQQVREHHTTLAETGAGDSLTARVHHTGAPGPHLAFLADAATAPADLDTRTDTTGRCAVAVVAATDHPARWNVHIDHDGALHVDWLSHTDARAARLPADQLAPLATLLRTARARAPDTTPPPTAAAPTATSDSGHTDERNSTMRHLATDTTAHPTGHTTIPAPPDQPARRPARRDQTPRPAPEDPHLDQDLADWYADTPTRPRISILGPVTVDAPGTPPAGRHRFYAEVVVYLATRGTRGATADQLDDALWPDRRVTDSSRRVALARIRRWLGTTPDGHHWLPRTTNPNRRYRLTDGYLLDWHLFHRLRQRAETDGTDDLRTALALVRGQPLEDAERPHTTGSRHPYRWLPTSGIPPHHLVATIVDTAHDLAQRSLATGDTTTARWAVDQAWRADPDHHEDQPWLDLMHITATEGHTTELRTLIQQLVTAREVEVPEDLEPETYQSIRRITGNVIW